MNYVSAIVVGQTVKFVSVKNAFQLLGVRSEEPKRVESNCIDFLRTLREDISGLDCSRESFGSQIQIQG